MEKETYWTQVFQDQKESGLPITQYCKQNGIIESTYYYYREKYLKKKSDDVVLATRDVSMFQQITIESSEEISFKVNGLTISCRKDNIKFILEALQ